MIQFSGIASGLDTSSIIQALLDVERLSLERLEARKSIEKQKLSLVGSLESMVKSLQKKAQEFADGSEFLTHQVSLSQEGFLDVQVSGLAESGTHVFEIESLAQAARFESSGLSDDSLDLGTGSISFDYGGVGYDVQITDAGASSLQDIAEAINDEVGDIVTATVINTGTETNANYEIILEGRETGSNNEIENLTVTGLADQGAFDFTRRQSADDALFTMDGIQITRSSNQFDDLLTGYSFTLEQAEVGTQIVVSSQIDASATMDNIEELIDEYNEIAEFVAAQNTYSEEGGAGGRLFGDRLLNQVSSTLYNGLFGVDLAAVQADTSGYSTLGLVGIDIGVDGTLSIDRAKMEEKLVDDPQAFTDLLTGELEYPSGSGETVNGAFGKLAAAIETLIEDKQSSSGDPLDGLFKARKDAIDTQIESYSDSILDEEYRLEKLEETLVARFAALEELLGGLQSQQAFLGSSL